VSQHRWRFVLDHVAYACPHFRVLHAKVNRPDGSAADYRTLDFPRPAVSALLRDAGGRVLLIKQHRFIVGRDVWALPSGGVEEGESIAGAAARELLEETGYRAARMEHLISYYPTYGVSNQVFHCFLGHDPIAAGVHDPNEVERIGWFSDAEVRAMIRRGEIPDGLSLTPLLHAALALEPQPADAAARCARVLPDERPR